MNREYFIDQSNLILLKKENNLMYQYSFTKHFWYSLPEMQGLDNSGLINKISEKEANEFIKYIDNLIESANKRKIK